MKRQEIAEAVQGEYGQPGSSFNLRIATVYRLSGGYELATTIRWGSNQGYLEEHGRHERRYRAATLDELMRVGVAESRADSDMNDPELSQAIRSACFDAQDQLVISWPTNMRPGNGG